MKIGDLEVPDSAVEAALKAAGSRIVPQTDFESAMSAKADLAKFRKVTGENRPIEEIDAILKAHAENEKKNKTEAELLKAEVKRLQDEMQAAAGREKLAQLEVKKRDVQKYFNEALQANGMKIIDPILEPFRAEFYNLDDSTVTPEQLKAQVNQAIVKANELQKGELLRLGLSGGSVDSSGPSFAPGNMQTNRTPGYQAAGETDLFEIMRQTSATPLGLPLGKPPGAK
jgi:predicted thioredoxin/glutaredoxin